MNNINIQNSSVSFNGLIVKGPVSDANVKKLGNFASKFENINFIEYLEKDFETDVVLNSEITQMSFSHHKYGNLSEKYGCGSYPLENVFRDITVVMKDLKSAISKASSALQKEISQKEATKRRC